MKEIIAKCQQTIKIASEAVNIYNPRKLKDLGYPKVERLPFSIIILLEQLLRNYDGKKFRDLDIDNLANWHKTAKNRPRAAIYAY